LTAKVLTIVVMTVCFLGVAELLARVFYRGTPAVLAEDLSTGQRTWIGRGSSRWP